MNILFICTGNTCRSPMAEGIFNTFIKEGSKLKNIKISSAGLMANNGDSVSENAVIACKEYGADISAHKSQQITPEMLNNTDLFVCMTMSHAQALISGNVPKNSIYILNVSDPYGGSLETYKECCRQIYDQLLILAELLERKYGNAI
ncbi:MAG: low molecular weight protein arginine phosphatase [Acutalibacteraceae bacterium]|nr:low molecular weight protein arginine phosphatase [Acutalibacteraceae bacterium]